MTISPITTNYNVNFSGGLRLPKPSENTSGSILDLRDQMKHYLSTSVGVGKPVSLDALDFYNTLNLLANGAKLSALPRNKQQQVSSALEAYQSSLKNVKK